MRLVLYIHTYITIDELTIYLNHPELEDSEFWLISYLKNKIAKLKTKINNDGNRSSGK